MINRKTLSSRSVDLITRTGRTGGKYWQKYSSQINECFSLNY